MGISKLFLHYNPEGRRNLNNLGKDDGHKAYKEKRNKNINPRYLKVNITQTTTRQLYEITKIRHNLS